MSEQPRYLGDNLQRPTVAQFPSGTMFHLFSTPVYAGRCANVDAIQKELDVSYRKNTFQYKESFCMTHMLSDTEFRGNIIEKDKLKELESSIHFHLSNFLQGICFHETKSYVPNIQYEINQSWFAKFGHRDYAQLHNHGNQDIAGVYYYKASSSEQLKESNTCWGNQPEGNMYLSSPASKSEVSFVFSHYAYKQSVIAEVGKIVLFPAYLDHGVTTNETDTDRVSLAFNITFAKEGL